MPQLRCNAHNCVSNTGEYCSRANINVGGMQATNSVETNCSNFCESQGSFTNSIELTPTPMMSVNCEATNCKFNNGLACNADSIAVSGSNASTCDGTCCSSFCEK